MLLDEFVWCFGVSKGMLVEIEGCKVNLSIVLLCKIVVVMGVFVVDFVNVVSELMVYFIDWDVILVLWCGEKGGSVKLMVGISGLDMLEFW